FLAALTPEQQAKATFDFKDNERSNWHFIPKARKGLPFKELTPAQRPLAFALLSTGLSQDGYAKATTIMSLEQVLGELEGSKAPFARDPEMYYLTIFGRPGEKWGWRVEGHHVSVNFTLAGGQAIAATPSFLGANPAEVRQGPRQGLRVLAAEEDLGRKLVKSFDDAQRQTAVMAVAAPKDIITAAHAKVKPLEPVGLSFAKKK